MYRKFFKRFFDIIFSLLCLALLGWIIALAYIIACIETKSNGFFFQERVGRDEKLFKIIKIKTMRDTDSKSSATTQKDDPRVTFFGRFFRKFKIDELPQLLNVFFGTMSMVGPRPTVESDIANMTEKQKKRLKVRPGITGLAQIRGNTELSWPQRLRYDLLYVNQISLSLDLFIIFKTFELILTNKIETHPKSSNEWRHK